MHQTGDLALVDAIATSLNEKGLKVSCFYAYSLREPDAQEELLKKATEEPPDVVLTMQRFSIGRLKL